MEEQIEERTPRSSKSGFSYTWLIVGAAAIAGLWYYFKNNTANANGIIPNILPTDPGNPNADPLAVNYSLLYLLPYWAWSIKRNGAWAQATADKARINKKAPNDQLWEDAAVKQGTGVMNPTGDDYPAFKTLVDSRVATDTASASLSQDMKINKAAQWVVNAQPWPSGTKFGVATTTQVNVSTTNNSLTGIL